MWSSIRYCNLLFSPNKDNLKSNCTFYPAWDGQLRITSSICFHPAWCVTSIAASWGPPAVAAQNESNDTRAAHRGGGGGREGGREREGGGRSGLFTGKPHRWWSTWWPRWASRPRSVPWRGCRPPPRCPRWIHLQPTSLFTHTHTHTHTYTHTVTCGQEGELLLSNSIMHVNREPKPLTGRKVICLSWITPLPPKKRRYIYIYI